MPIEILMPALSPTMTEGNLLAWQKKPGDPVSPGDILVEIETDKATMEVEAVDEGILATVMVSDYTQGVPVNRPIAVLLEDGETEDDLRAFLKTLEGKASIPSPDQGGGQALSGNTAENRASEAQDLPKESAESLSKSGETSKGFNAEREQTSRKDDLRRIFASPLARRLASQNALALESLQGSGPRGRIIKRDIEKALIAGVGTPDALTSTDTGAQGGGAFVQKRNTQKASSFSGFEPASEAVPINTMRRVIASRLTESKQTIPHFYVKRDVCVDALLTLRARINEARDEGRISVNDFIIRALALALKRVPDMNVAWGGDAVLKYVQADVAVAVSVDGGLITPVVRAAEQKSLSDISSEMKGLVERARANKLKPQEFQGGTFSLSNLGMFGVEEFTAIVNPPQAGILAVGGPRKVPAMLEDGRLVTRQVLTLTLSVDHRIVDGVLAATFMECLKALIEEPITILL
jgi:pyruvate dehydrogenase E2 component (dihydrolipoamide acetyltransferase)